ncbi:MAG: hypothetical protein LQ339_001835 [Xanthoria mediterranea]|nr:MAG: hypothetical protein LQ339_001835 [Xanthoria mediterranea]
MSTSETSSLCALASVAAVSLRQIADQRVRLIHNTPSITLPQDVIEVNALVIECFKNLQNLEPVMKATHRQAADLKRHFQCEPIVYGMVPTLGRIKMIDPKKFIALVALDDLDREIGLPIWKYSPACVARGETVIFDSDQIHIWLPNSFGGLAVLLLFEYACPPVQETSAGVA